MDYPRTRQFQSAKTGVGKVTRTRRAAGSRTSAVRRVALAELDHRAFMQTYIVHLRDQHRHLKVRQITDFNPFHVSEIVCNRISGLLPGSVGVRAGMPCAGSPIVTPTGPPGPFHGVGCCAPAYRGTADMMAFNMANGCPTPPCPRRWTVWRRGLSCTLEPRRHVP